MDEFLKIKVRETSGSTSAGRFDYQKDWSICKLLEVHSLGSDYVLVFDYHDDLIIMDSETNPTKISFFQIKGKKSGNWSITDLLRSGKSTDGATYLFSIIGKLYLHKINFPDKIESVNFVSNARFNLDLKVEGKSESKDEICIIELDKNAKAKIHAKLKQEHSLPKDDIDFEKISFVKVIDLSLDDSAIHTTGKLSKFLEERNPQKKFKHSVIYKVLFDEIKRLTSYSKEIANKNELLQHKALSKSKFNEMLDKIGVNKDYDEIWKTIQPAMVTEGVSYSDVLEFKKQWDKLQMERMTYNNEYLFKMLGSIGSIASEQERQGNLKGLRLMEMVDKIYTALDNTFKDSLYDKQFIQVAIISAIHD